MRRERIDVIPLTHRCPVAARSVTVGTRARSAPRPVTRNIAPTGARSKPKRASHEPPEEFRFRTLAEVIAAGQQELFV